MVGAGRGFLGLTRRVDGSLPATDCSAYVMAGGRSRRMGADKALLDWGGQPLLVHQVCRLAGLFPEVHAVAKPSSSVAGLGIPLVADASPEFHPVAGWLAALRHSSRPWVWLMAVDLPLVSLEWIAAALTHRRDTPLVATDASGRPQPALAILPVQRAAAVETWWRVHPSGSLEALLAHLGADAVPEAVWEIGDPRREGLTNLNTPQDYHRALERMKDRMDR